MQNPVIIPLKDNLKHISCIICKDISLGGESYVDETIRNCQKR